MEKQHEEEDNSEIMMFKSVVFFCTNIKKYKHCAIALHKNLSVDFYFDYRNVETLKSSNDEVYFDIDIDFCTVYFRSMGLQKSKNDDQKEEKIVTNYKCTLKWKQRIGKSVAFYKKKRWTDNDHSSGCANVFTHGHEYGYCFECKFVVGLYVY